MTTVMCVDDDVLLTDLLSYVLTRAGYTVQVAHRGLEALQMVKACPPDALILDLNLPDVDGLIVCARVRAIARLPIIMLTARGSDQDVICGFAEGADDYVAKPFNMQVLLCRLQVMLRRVAAERSFSATSTTTYRLGDGWFYAHRHELVGSTHQVRLTPTEGKILRLLLECKGQVLPIERIMERVWGYDAESDTCVIRTHVHHLRRKMERVLGGRALVHTVPGLGYTLLHEPAAPADGAYRQASAAGAAAD